MCWINHPDDGREVCRSCGYNKPYHETRCKERGLTDLEIRCEIANMSDAQSNERCVKCGRRIGGAGAVIFDNGLAHKFDCTTTGIW
jgi:hypothetical protein